MDVGMTDNRHRDRRALVMLLLVVVPLAARSDSGSKRERFEKDATRPRPSEEEPSPTPPTPKDDYPAPDYRGAGGDRKEPESAADFTTTMIMAIPLAIAAGGRLWAVRAGYHWLESPNESLTGPFIGLSLRL